MLQNEIPGLTGLRAYLALWVVFFHIHANPLTPMPQGIVQQLASSGDRAVPIFFALSGYLLTHVYSSIQKSFSSKDFLRYLKKRLIKLYPVHLFVLLCYLFATSLATALNYSFSYPEFFQRHLFIENLFMTQAWFHQTLSWNIVAWSISVEWFLYLFLFPLNMIKPLNQRPWRLIVTYIALILFINSSLSFFSTWIKTGITFFVAGVLVYKGASSLPDKTTWKFDLLFLITSCCLILVCIFGKLTEEVALACAVSLLISIPKTKVCSDIFFDNKIAHTIGVYSYSLYMVHVLVQTGIYQGQKAFPHAIFSTSWVAYLTAYFCALLIATWLTFQIIEKNRWFPKILKALPRKL